MEKLTVTIERRIATVRIRNPPLNILDDDLRRALFAAFGELEARDDIHVVVVEAGPGQAFSAGSNIREFPSDEIGGVAKIRFEQYLTTTRIPAFEYRLEGSRLSYRWADVVPGFAMPVKVRVSSDSTVRLVPTEAWQTAALPLRYPEDFAVDPNFYVIPRRAD